MVYAERLLVVVRTYPDLSNKYDETVCTAAITEEGQWRRLYPVPLRYLAEEKQYRVGSVIRARLEEPANDPRPESRRLDVQSIQIVGKLITGAARHDWIAASRTFPSVQALRDAGRSIGPVAVQRVDDFIAEPRSGEWTPKEKQILDQGLLHGSRLDLEKIPFRFRLHWIDADGQEQVNTFRSWEVCQTWRQWRARYGPDEVIPRMREQWLEKVLPADREIRFFMGNLAQPKLRHVFHITGTHTTPTESTSAGLFDAT